MTAEIDRTVALIRKLLSLAAYDGVGDAHDRASLALQKAQQLMQEANLTMAQLEASGVSGGDGSNRVKDGVASRTPYKWHRTLMAQISVLNSVHCQVRFRKLDHTSTFDGYSLIGREVNIASTRVMHEYLVGAVERVARTHFGDDSSLWFTRSANAFKEGAASRVVERLEERHEQLMRDQEREAREARARATHPSYSGSGALAIVMRDHVQSELDLNKDFHLGWEPGTTAGRRREAEEGVRTQAAERAARLAQILADNPGIGEEVAGWMASGWARKDAEDILHRAPEPARPEKPAHPMTDKQREKAMARQQRADDAYWARRAREDRRTDPEAFRAGRGAGEDIGLDQQVGRDDRRRIS